MACSSNSTTLYIAYPKALNLLANRLDASPDELAAWVWMEPVHGGLAAYQNANELDPPPRFYYSFCNGGSLDYLDPLMACWFRADDIANFEPTDRYITGEVLIDRWRKLPGIHPETYIKAKIAESRLMDFHPVCGGTQGTFSDDKSFPPLESGLFVLSHIEAIEAEDFDGSLTEKETSCERQKRLKIWFQEECEYRGDRGALKRTALREGITRQTLSNILQRPI